MIKFHTNNIHTIQAIKIITNIIRNLVCFVFGIVNLVVYFKISYCGTWISYCLKESVMCSSKQNKSKRNFREYSIWKTVLCYHCHVGHKLTRIRPCSDNYMHCCLWDVLNGTKLVRSHLYLSLVDEAILRNMNKVICWNNIRAKCFKGNIDIHLNFVSFLHIDVTQALKIVPYVREGPTYSIKSISWLLMSWRRKEPWYWPS